MSETVTLVLRTALVAALPPLIRWLARDDPWTRRAMLFLWATMVYALSSMWFQWAGCYPAWLYPLFNE